MNSENRKYKVERFKYKINIRIDICGNVFNGTQNFK